MNFPPMDRALVAVKIVCLSCLEYLHGPNKINLLHALCVGALFTKKVSEFCTYANGSHLNGLGNEFFLRFSLPLGVCIFGNWGGFRAKGLAFLVFSVGLEC